MSFKKNIIQCSLVNDANKTLQFDKVICRKNKQEFHDITWRMYNISVKQYTLYPEKLYPIYVIYKKYHEYVSASARFNIVLSSWQDVLSHNIAAKNLRNLPSTNTDAK